MRAFPAPPRHPPLFLPELAKCLVLPGIAGNYASTPDAPANQLTGDIDIRWYGSMDTWTPATYNVLVAKDNRVGAGRNYNLYMEDAVNPGRLGFVRTIGGAVNNAVCSVATGLAPGTIKWVKVTHVPATGVVLWYLSNDGIIWNQLGGVGGITIGVATVANNPLTVGSDTGALDMLAGKTFYAEVRNGIDGPVVASFNPNRALKRSPTVTSPTGELWTVNTSGTPKAYLF